MPDRPLVRSQVMLPCQAAEVLQQVVMLDELLYCW